MKYAIVRMREGASETTLYGVNGVSSLVKVFPGESDQVLSRMWVANLQEDCDPSEVLTRIRACEGVELADLPPSRRAL